MHLHNNSDAIKEDILVARLVPMMHPPTVVFLSFLTLTVTVKLRNSSSSSIVPLLCHHSCSSIKFPKVQPKTTGLEELHLESGSKWNRPTHQTLPRNQNPKHQPLRDPRVVSSQQRRGGRIEPNVPKRQSVRFPPDQDRQI
jgi:hypothetical protein